MGNLLYELLGSIGYSHPVHPVFVHLPVGLTLAAVFFWLMASVTQRQAYRTTAYHIIVLAFVFSFVAIPLGIFDWQRFYGGAWLFEIKMKLGLAAIYVVVVAAAVIFGRRHRESPLMAVLYLLGAMAVMGLGFFGGELVFHGFTPEAPVEFKAGQRIFEGHCSGCHRRGENIIEPNLPLRNAPQLRDFNAFVAFIRKPAMPDGSPGAMPQFASNSISDADAKQLYDYLFFAFHTQTRPGS
jgi:uncharacterized membrane protein